MLVFFFQLNNLLHQRRDVEKLVWLKDFRRWVSRLFDSATTSFDTAMGELAGDLDTLTDILRGIRQVGYHADGFANRTAAVGASISKECKAIVRADSMAEGERGGVVEGLKRIGLVIVDIREVVGMIAGPHRPTGAAENLSKSR